MLLPLALNFRPVNLSSHPVGNYWDSLKPVKQLPIYLHRGFNSKGYHYSCDYKTLIDNKIQTTIANGRVASTDWTGKVCDFSNYMGASNTSAMPEGTAWEDIPIQGIGKPQKKLRRNKNDYTIEKLEAESTCNKKFAHRGSYSRYSKQRTALYDLEIDYQFNKEHTKRRHLFKTLHIPIEDQHPALLSLDEVNQVYNLLLETLITNKRMLIHCAAGIGRTGNIWLPMLILMQFAYPQLVAANFPKLKSVYATDSSPAELIMNALAISREFRPGVVASSRQLKDCYRLSSHMLRAHAAMLRQKLHHSEQRSDIR